MAAANKEPNQTIGEFIAFLGIQIALLGQGPQIAFGGNYHPICDNVTWGLDNDSLIQRYIYSPFLRLKSRIDNSSRKDHIYSLLVQYGVAAIPWLLACIELRLRALYVYAYPNGPPHTHSDRCPNYGHIYPITQSFIALGFCLKLSQREFNFNALPASLEEGEIFNPETFKEFALSIYPDIRRLDGFSLYERVPIITRYSAEVCIFRIIDGEKGLSLYRDFCEDCGVEPCICVHACDECKVAIDTKYLFLNDIEIGEYHIYHEQAQENIVEKIQEIFRQENLGEFKISNFTNKIEDLRCACGMMVVRGDKNKHILCSFLHVDLRLKIIDLNDPFKLKSREFDGSDLYSAILKKYKPELAKERFSFKKTKTKRSKRSVKKTKRSVKKTKRSVKKTKRSVKKTMKSKNKK
jgi:hypothetical protein